MQAYSLQNSSYHGLLQEVLISPPRMPGTPRGPYAHTTRASRMPQLYERGQAALARKRLTPHQDRLPRLRVSLALYRARGPGPAQRVDTALPRVGKPGW